MIHKTLWSAKEYIYKHSRPPYNETAVSWKVWVITKHVFWKKKILRGYELQGCESAYRAEVHAIIMPPISIVGKKIPRTALYFPPHRQEVKRGEDGFLVRVNPDGSLGTRVSPNLYPLIDFEVHEEHVYYSTRIFNQITDKCKACRNSSTQTARHATTSSERSARECDSYEGSIAPYARMPCMNNFTSNDKCCPRCGNPYFSFSRRSVQIQNHYDEHGINHPIYMVLPHHWGSTGRLW